MGTPLNDIDAEHARVEAEAKAKAEREAEAEKAKRQQEEKDRRNSNRWSLLVNVAAKDSHSCKVGKAGPSCYIVQNAVRVLGDVTQVAEELDITLSGVAQALNYAAEFQHRPSSEDSEMFEHAAAMLFADED